MKMIAAGTNAAVVLIGHVNTLDKPASALVRLDKPKVGVSFLYTFWFK